MAFIFTTALHFPEGTPYEDIRFEQFVADDAHEQSARELQFIGGTPMRAFMTTGLTEGWILRIA